MREKGDKNDIDNGYDLWMDVVEPSSEAFFISKRNLAWMLTLSKWLNVKHKTQPVHLL